jgi:hypothetical protein
VIHYDTVFHSSCNKNTALLNLFIYLFLHSFIYSFFLSFDHTSIHLCTIYTMKLSTTLASQPQMTGRLLNKQLGWDMERSRPCLIWDTASESDSRDWGKPRKLSARIGEQWTEILIQGFPNKVSFSTSLNVSRLSYSAVISDARYITWIQG